jgi:hypothetical protein
MVYCLKTFQNVYIHKLMGFLLNAYDLYKIQNAYILDLKNQFLIMNGPFFFLHLMHANNTKKCAKMYPC